MAGLEGTRLGDYELIERIGVGGMAEVYRARQQTAFGREVALKVMLPDLDESGEFRALFARGSGDLPALSSPHSAAHRIWRRRGDAVPRHAAGARRYAARSAQAARWPAVAGRGPLAVSPT